MRFRNCLRFRSGGGRRSRIVRAWMRRWHIMTARRPPPAHSAAIRFMPSPGISRMSAALCWPRPALLHCHCFKTLKENRRGKAGGMVWQDKPRNWKGVGRRQYSVCAGDYARSGLLPMRSIRGRSFRASTAFTAMSARLQPSSSYSASMAARIWPSISIILAYCA